MRTLSLMIIAVCFALMGRNIADSYKKRVSMLEKTEAMITLIRDEIDFCALPINEMIHLISQKESLKQLAFIEECYRFLSSGLEFPYAWNNSLEDRKNIAFLKKKDVDLLKSFGENLGITDSAGQLSNCNVYLGLLKINYNEALKDKERYSGLTTAIGFLVGLGVLIVFI